MIAMDRRKGPRHPVTARFAVRGLALAGALLLSSCGGTDGPASAGPTVDLAPRPREGLLYEILHRETRELVGEAPRVVETRTLLRVMEGHPDGSRRLRLRLFRSGDDDAEEPELGDEVVDADVDATGAVVGEPTRLCGTIDGLRVTRYVRHLLGARALVARGVGEGDTWRDDYLSDATEMANRAVFRIDEIRGDTVRGQLLSRISLERGDVGPYRVTGEGSVRGRFTVSAADGFSGHADLRSEIRGSVHDQTSGHRRRGVIRTRSQMLVRPAEDQLLDRVPAAAIQQNAAGAGVFDPQLVVRQIRGRLLAIQACYEQQLRDDPELSGRIMVRFRIDPDGRVRDAEATENSSGSAALAACVTSSVSQFRFRPGPVCGSVTFAYPFVFAPQRGP